MIFFETVSQLENILLQSVREYHYDIKKDIIEYNMEIAKQYRVAEDWIYKCYWDKKNKDWSWYVK